MGPRVSFQDVGGKNAVNKRIACVEGVTVETKRDSY